MKKMTAEQLYQIFLKHPNIVTDSRKIEAGCLFFALKGEQFNGNQFASEALNNGAAFAIIDDAQFRVSERTILVDNVLKTLQELANYHRIKLGIPILAITGSNGKTTTKELISAVLSARFELVCTRGNLNNHIGVPLTLLQMDCNTEFGIIEMGANHAGEIAALCTIADPDYGIITNIGVAHLEGFGSFETIRKTKAELYQHVKKKKGTIFYNRENPVLVDLVSTIERRVSFGEENADLTGKYICSSPFLHIQINFPKEVREIQTQLIGRYNFENLMAAACIGHFFNVNPQEIQAALAGYQPINNRSQMIEKNGLKIVMDAYNANPTSMKASITSFISVFQSPRILILGDMLELGPRSLEEHRAILKNISSNKFKEVFLVGPIFTEVSGNLSYKTFLNSDELSRHLQKYPLHKGNVLIKGSRGIQLEKVVDYL